MSKNILTVFILFVAGTFVTSHGNAQRMLEVIAVKDRGIESMLTCTPRVSSYTTADGLNVMVSPISADLLNQVFTAKSGQDGRFHIVRFNQSVLQFSKDQRDMNPLSSYDNLKEALDWLANNGRMSMETHDALRAEIDMNYYQLGLISNPYERIPSRDNPYCINDKYLTVFQVDIANPTDKAILFKDAFRVRDQFETLEKLSPDFLRQNLEVAGDYSVGKRLMLERYDLKDQFYVPARTSLVRYFATLPIDMDSDSLRVMVNGNGPVMRWAIKQISRPISNDHMFVSLNVSINIVAAGLLPESEYTVVVDMTPDRAFAHGRGLFVNTKEMNEKIHIATIAVVNGSVYFGEKVIIPNQYADMKRMRRQEVVVQVVPVNGLRRISP